MTEEEVREGLRAPRREHNFNTATNATMKSRSIISRKPRSTDAIKTAAPTKGVSEAYVSWVRNVIAPALVKTYLDSRPTKVKNSNE